MHLSHPQPFSRFKICRWWSCLVLSCWVWLSPWALYASTVIALSETELTAAAEVIALGAILDVQTVLLEEEQIFTEVRLQVQRALKGCKGGEILTILWPGGELPNGLVRLVHGAPVVTRGERALMFLGAFKEHTYAPLGLAYGVFVINEDEAGQAVAARKLGGLNLVTRQGKVLSLLDKQRLNLFRTEFVPSLLKRFNQHVLALPGKSTL